MQASKLAGFLCRFFSQLAAYKMDDECTPLTNRDASSGPRLDKMHPKHDTQFCCLNYVGDAVHCRPPTECYNPSLLDAGNSHSSRHL